MHRVHIGYFGILGLLRGRQTTGLALCLPQVHCEVELMNAYIVVLGVQILLSVGHDSLYSSKCLEMLRNAQLKC